MHQGAAVLLVDERVLRRLQEEEQRRAENRALIAELKAKDAALAGDPVLMRWRIESQPCRSRGRRWESISLCCK